MGVDVLVVLEFTHVFWKNLAFRLPPADEGPSAPGDPASIDLRLSDAAFPESGRREEAAAFVAESCHGATRPDCQCLPAGNRGPGDVLP